MRATTAKALPKGHSRFTDEQQELILWNPNYCDALVFGFDCQEVPRLIDWYKECLWQLLVRLSFLQ